MDLDTEAKALLRRQDGLATRAQLYRMGVTRSELRWKLGRYWTAVLGQVIATDHSPLTPRRRLVAAALEAGPEGLLTAEHACLLHGLTSAVGTRPVRVVVPANQGARRVGYVDIRRTRRHEPAPSTDKVLRLVTPARATMDAARSATSANEVRALVIEAVQRRIVTIEELQHELEAGPQRSRAFARSALQEARMGVWSVPEADLLPLCRSSRVLSHALPNPRLSLAGRPLTSPDLWFDDVALALMVHSRAHHERDADWEGTVEQDGELVAAGVVVLGFTPRSIATRPAQVLARIEVGYRVAASRPRPAILMKPRGWGMLA